MSSRFPSLQVSLPPGLIQQDSGEAFFTYRRSELSLCKIHTGYVRTKSSCWKSITAPWSPHCVLATHYDGYPIRLADPISAIGEREVKRHFDAAR